VVWIKERFALEIGPTVFSSYRSQMRAKEGARNGTARTRKVSRDAGLLEVLRVVRCVKAVVDRHGVAAVQEVLGLAASYQLAFLAETLQLIVALGGEGTVERGAVLNGAAVQPDQLSPASRLARTK
jgi:hypothetical protein